MTAVSRLRRAICAISAVVLATILTGCGESGVASPSAPPSSPVILETPPETVSVGKFRGMSYSARSGSNEIDLAGNGTDVTVTIPNVTGILNAVTWTRSGTHYLVLSTVDSSDVFRLQRLHDANDDHVPDLGTLTTLVTSSPGKAYITAMVDQPTAGRAYLLDRRCQDILLAVDSNADGWPDEISSTKFLAAVAYPGLLDVTWLLAGANAYEVQGRTGRPGPVESLARRWTFSDTLHIGVASQITYTPPGGAPPRIDGKPYVGQSQIKVYPGSGGIGKTAEVWRLTSTGADDVLLGSAVLSESGAAIGLSSTLAAGQRVGVRYQGDTSSQLNFAVAPAFPQIWETSPMTASPSSATVMDLIGVNFTSNTVVRLIGVDLDQTLAVTFIDSGRIQVTIPAVGASHAGPANLTVSEPSQDVGEEGAFVQSISICEP